MRLWFRRPLGSPIFLASAGLLAINLSTASAQQSSQPEPKPNALRLGDARGPTIPNAKEPSQAEAPPVIVWQNEDETITSQDILIIGSADTQLASGDDIEQPMFASILTEPSVDLSVALEVATASMSHISPFFFWMAGPTSDLFRIETEGDQIEVDASEIASDTEPQSQLLAENEPPRMVASLDAADGDMDPSEQDRNLSDEKSDRPGDAVDTEATEDTSSIANAAPVKKPAPRKVRMPFEEKPGNYESEPNKVSAKPRGNSTPVPQRDPDSELEQEEPQLELNKRGGSDKELQGVDAMNASKPGSHRREIRIEDAPNGKAVPPIVQKQALEPALAQRLARTDACLSYYLNNPESTSVRSPWAVMHALIAFGPEYELVHGAGRVNAIGWMCHNGTCRTQRMFTPKGNGFVPNVGGGVQGHEGQFLAILAQSNVPLDYPIQIGNAKYKVEDLVRYEMATCKERSELTFKLIGLSYYLDSNKQWKANDGKIWSIQKLIQEELAQPIVGSACGGTHRLMGFSFSLRQRQLQNQPINGQYARASKFIKDYIAYTWQLQNPDGSFSTSWYEGRANEPNDERKVQTSGHMLEWLMFTLPDNEINQPRVAKGIEFLLTKIYDQRDKKWPIGPRGHATRAIALYQERMSEIAQSAAPKSAPIIINSASKAPAAPIRK